MDHAPRLRGEQTDAETRLWAQLRNHQCGVTFRRQHLAEGFILDFACVELKLAVELDGGQHAEQVEKAAQRTAFLENAGWKVLRFHNHDVLAQTDAVMDAIGRAVQQASASDSGLDFAHAFAPSASFQSLHLRASLNARIRAFFTERNITEVETPVLSKAGNTDPNIASFSLEFSGRNDGAPRTRWLRTSPEYPLKRLLAAGFGDCYELGRVFRDGEAGARHNPEFTMLEWYRVGWDHQQLIAEATDLVNHALALVDRSAILQRISYRELYLRDLGIDPMQASNEELRAALGDMVIDPEGLTRDDWLDLLMTHRLQPGFAPGQLLAIHDYPASQCALARIGEDARGTPVAERFEMYLGPLEIANGYHELADATEQGARFDRDHGVRRQRGDPSPPRDGHLLAALASGFPDCAGVALGVDRLLMAMLDTDCIADVLAFDFGRA